MTESLEQFLSNVRSSCETHAERKGYKESGGDRNVLGELTKAMGVEAHHAIGEILAKLVEFKAKPRRVLAEKIAGWAWRLWLTAPADPRLYAETTYPEDWTACEICGAGNACCLHCRHAPLPAKSDS